MCPRLPMGAHDLRPVIAHGCPRLTPSHSRARAICESDVPRPPLPFWRRSSSVLTHPLSIACTWLMARDQLRNRRCRLEHYALILALFHCRTVTFPLLFSVILQDAGADAAAAERGDHA